MILLYHQVSEKKAPFLGADLNSVSPLDFRKQMNKVDPVALDNYRAGNTAITFDDGYKDFYENVFPIIKNQEIPVTLFLSVNLLNRRRLPLEFFLTELIRGKRRIVSGGKLLETATVAQKKKVYIGLKERLKRETFETREKFLDFLERRNQFQCDRDLMLDWEQCQEIARSPFIEIGSHGINHVPLTILEKEEQRRELKESKKILNKRLEEEIRFFSFPYGEWNEELRNLAKQAGYQKTFSTNSGDSNFVLSRKEPSNLQ